MFSFSPKLDGVFLLRKKFAMNTNVFYRGVAFIDFPLGKADANGRYQSSTKNLMKYPVGGIVAQTESPSGALVTDPYGAVVPVTNSNGSLVYGPEGGRFVPVTESNGQPVTNAQGNIIPEKHENGTMILQPSPTLPPELVGSILDKTIYGGQMPSGVTDEVLAVLEGAQIPGDPIMKKIQLKNGTVLIPGLNFTLSPRILHLLPNLKKSISGGIVISDSM